MQLEKLLLSMLAISFSVSYAGVLYVEIPEEMPPTAVTNPTAADRGQLLSISREALSELDNRYAERVIIFTKNGERIIGGGNDTDGGPKFGHMLFQRGIGDWEDKTWDDALWHLNQAGGGAYDIARNDVFGPPFTHTENEYRTVTVDLDSTWPADFTYYADLETIVLRYWRVGPNQNEVRADTDRAIFTKAMLYAFRHEWPATYDHFGGATINAAWVEIQNRIAAAGDETHFNDLDHYEKLPEEVYYQRPYYVYYDDFNSYEFSTRLGWFDSPYSTVNAGIRDIRYGAAGYCWWKLLAKHDDFIKNFNGELAKTWNVTWPEKPTFQHLYLCAENAWGGGQIENETFHDWFVGQPILNVTSWAENVCAVGCYKNKAKIFNYRRDNFWSGGQWQETEEPNNCDNPGCFVRVTKTRWNGLSVSHDFANLDDGFAEWSMPMVDDEGRLAVGAEHYVNNEPFIGSTTFAIDSTTAYETDEIFGIVADAVDGEGTVHVSKNGVVLGEYPVEKYVYKIPNQGGDIGAGAGEYSIWYEPGGLKGQNNPNIAVIQKDGGCYFDARNYLQDLDPAADLNGNGIPDDDEQALAEKFVPEIVMHAGNEMIPTNVGIYVDPGRGPLEELIVDQAGRLIARNTWWPTPEHTMQDIFAETKPWPAGLQPDGFIHTWFLVFGPDADEITVQYWHDNYSYIIGQGLYTGATVYYNIFKEAGHAVIQYWFFYPFNDWGDDHEGDWEHINVKLNSADLARSGVDEVLYYFHRQFKTLDGADVDYAPGTETHAQVFVGGQFPPSPVGRGDCSGGSYWRSGIINDVWGLVDEHITEGTRVRWSWFTNPDHHLERLVRNDKGNNLWWSEFPSHWGRMGAMLAEDWSEGVRMDAPPSPLNHECFEVYRHPDYTEYYLGLLAELNPNPSATPPGPVSVAALPPTVSPLNNASARAGGAVSPFDSVSTSPFPGISAQDPSAVTPPLAGGELPSGLRPPAALSCSPNPVKAAATIRFSLEKEAYVKVAVYDLAGRRVATLAEGNFPPGEHSISWSPGGLMPGVYIYQLRAGDKAVTRRVVVAP